MHAPEDSENSGLRIPGHGDDSHAPGPPPNRTMAALRNETRITGGSHHSRGFESQRPRGVFLAVDSASLEAEKPEGDGARGDDTPLVRVHGAEVANQIAPGIKKPEAQGKIREKGDEHGELGWDLGVRRRVTRDQSRGYA